jgi:hypothetical protein
MVYIYFAKKEGKKNQVGRSVDRVMINEKEPNDYATTSAKKDV